MGDYGKKSISPFFILFLQIESQYLINCKRYRSEILHTSRV